MVNAAKYIFSQSCSETAGSQSRDTVTIHHEGRKAPLLPLLHPFTIRAEICCGIV